MAFQDLCTEIDNAFDQIDQTILINNQEYKELIDCTYKLEKEDILELIPVDIAPHQLADQLERAAIFYFFDEYNFDADMNTRQAVLQLKYEDDPIKASCIPCIQIIIRNNSVYIFVFFRSSNYSRNFKYDNQTFSILMSKISSKLNKQIGFVDIKIISLHQPIS